MGGAKLGILGLKGFQGDAVILIGFKVTEWSLGLEGFRGLGFFFFRVLGFRV